MGSVGRFRAADPVAYARGARVITRTARGLEIGEVLAPPDDASEPTESDGTILRSMSVEDRLLEARLAKNCHSAYEACVRRLDELGLSACLMDVEHLFDGRTLIFYFLGDVSPEIERVTDDLAEIYDAQVQFRSFSETLTAGCGPDCGTESASGHGCSSCATGCAVADACSPRRQR